MIDTYITPCRIWTHLIMALHVMTVFIALKNITGMIWKKTLYNVIPWSVLTTHFDCVKCMQQVNIINILTCQLLLTVGRRYDNLSFSISKSLFHIIFVFQWKRLARDFCLFWFKRVFSRVFTLPASSVSEQRCTFTENVMSIKEPWRLRVTGGPLNNHQPANFIKEPYFSMSYLIISVVLSALWI